MSEFTNIAIIATITKKKNSRPLSMTTKEIQIVQRAVSGVSEKMDLTLSQLFVIT